MNWQRATTNEKKELRKDAIYSAAMLLFQNNGYDKVSFNGIAAEAGFTKSNLYRYFNSKEEIFLTIFSDLFEAWVDDCKSKLTKLEQEVNVETFATTWLESMQNKEEYLDLATLMLTSLERNSSFEQLVTFKRTAMNRLYELALEITRIYPQLSVPSAFKYLNISFAATTNYWAGATENPALTKVYQQDEFKILTPNFEQDLSFAIQIILRGLMSQN